MKIIVACIAVLFTHIVVAQVPTVSCGKIVRFSNKTSRYVTARNVDVWLPDGYDTRNKYAVLYMHDGQMLFDSSITWNKQEWKADETACTLIKNRTVQPFIIVGIWNGGSTRHTDYFPQKPFESLPIKQQDSLYTANRTNGAAVFQQHRIQSDNYLKFLVKELKPFIDSAFSTFKDQPHTFIAGSSMGGLISMYALCEYPKIFGGAACLSTHWPGIFTLDNNPIPQAFFNYLKKKLPKPSTHRIYFDYGNQTLDAMYPALQQKVDSIVQQRGYTSNSWQTLFFDGENHSEEAWAKRLHQPFMFLMRK